MRVRCIAERLTHEQAVAHYYPHPPDMRISFAASLGVEYEVYSINCTYPFAMLGISDETGLLYPTPLCLFEIIDPRPASSWVVRVNEKGVVHLEPPSFHEHYFEDLADGVPEVDEDFRQIREQVESV